MLLGHELDITIKGTRNAVLKKRLKRAADFYAKHLLPAYIRKAITIELAIVKIKTGEEGFCEIVGYNSKNKAREFKIELDKSLDAHKMLESLAHEMVHLKQYAMGELNDDMTRWKGRSVDSDKINYWDHPWEIEAYGRERGLFARFIQNAFSQE